MYAFTLFRIRHEFSSKSQKSIKQSTIEKEKNQAISHERISFLMNLKIPSNDQTSLDAKRKHIIWFKYNLCVL